MISREELAARIFSLVAAKIIYDDECDDTKDMISLYNVEECFRASDAFLAYAAKQREPKACEIDAPPTQSTCRHDLSEYVWVESARLYHCRICWPKASEKPEPPKPERVAKRLQVGSLVRVFDRYRLAVPCIGTIIKTEGVVQGCLVQLENGSHGRAEERYPDGIHVCFEQLREILPGDEK